MSGVSVSWTVAGDLRVDDMDEDQPKLHVNFYDWRRLTRDQKLRLLRVIVETALESPDLVDAVDPHDGSAGTLSTRVKSCSFSCWHPPTEATR